MRRNPVYVAAEALLVALKEQQRLESDMANAHVSHGPKVGPAIHRLRKALKEVSA